jgi:hypothetical protein
MAGTSPENRLSPVFIPKPRNRHLEAGFADCMLFVYRRVVGIVETKKEGTTVGGVDTQSKK